MWIFRPGAEEIEREAKCKSCGATIIWAVTTNGAKAPMNADFVPLDLKTIKAAGGAEVEIVSVAGKASHFATCPQAQQFRRKPR